MKPPTLSALVVAHNEEVQLAACLEALRFADETVVVLDRCTDRSREIAQGFGARLVEGAWELEGPRRNAGIAACSGDWILEVDADERVPPDLAAEIRQAIAGAGALSYFYIRYDNYIGNRLIRYGWGAYNGVRQTVRLFRPGAKVWGDQLVHPAVALRGKSGRLNGAIVHYVDRDVDDTFARLNRYTTLAARQAILDHKAPGLGATFRRLVTRFCKSYIGRRGYREGVYGMILAVFSGLYPLLVYLKVKAYLNKSGGREPRA